MYENGISIVDFFSEVSEHSTVMILYHRTAVRYSWTRARDRMFPSYFNSMLFLQKKVVHDFPSQPPPLIYNKQKVFIIPDTKREKKKMRVFLPTHENWKEALAGTHTHAYTYSHLTHMFIFINTCKHANISAEIHPRISKCPQNPPHLISPHGLEQFEGARDPPMCPAVDRALTHVELNDLEAAREGHAPPSLK